jgi:RES domain-containing protein
MAFLHADERGGRFTGSNLGGWYCSFDLQTAITETIHHHTRRLSFSESGYHQTIQMRELCARVDEQFDDIRGMKAAHPELYHPDSYVDSQRFGAERRDAGSNGICYDSVRLEGGVNLVIYRPRLVLDVMQGDHFQYEWTGSAEPLISKLTNVAIAGA